MNELFERIRDAITSADVMGSDAQVRAVLEVMREPTLQMVDLAWAEALAQDAEGVWQKMIDVLETTP